MWHVFQSKTLLTYKCFDLPVYFHLFSMWNFRTLLMKQTSSPDWKVCLARPISLPRTLNFSRGSSREIFVKQQKETIELLFSDTNTAAQAICTKERSPAHSANFPIWHQASISFTEKGYKGNPI